MQRKILDYIYNLSLKHGKLLLVTMAVITVIFGAFIPRLIISSSQQNLIPEDDPEQARYIKFNKEFGSSDYLIVVLDGDSDACKAYADDFAHEIEKEQKWVKSIFYKIDTSVLLKRAPLFASVDDLNKGYSLLQKNREMLKRIQNISGLHGLLNEITENFKRPNTDINVESATQIISIFEYPLCGMERLDREYEPEQIKDRGKAFPVRVLSDGHAGERGISVFARF